jgi:hypothetical protein
MNDPRNASSLHPSPAADAPATRRPAYEPPRLTKKKAVTKATLFSGGGGPTSLPPLVSTG